MWKELLILDIKTGIISAGQLHDVKRFDEITEVIHFLIDSRVKRIIVSSVTLHSDELKSLFKPFDNALIFNSATPIPIQNNYQSPQTLGLDRLAAAVGASHRFPNRDILIIDMGTAIKYDLVSSHGVFEGGMIGPGLHMRFKSLHTFTQRLPLIEEVRIPPLVGSDTVTCMQSGVVNGMIAEINGIIKQFSRSSELKVILTGGDAAFFESQINYPTFAAPNLVLEGLYRILKHNV
jgi:type III pantothenate kinase